MSVEKPDTSTAEGRAAQMVQFSMAQPHKVPAKFKREDGTVDGDALLQSYTELERRQSGGSPAPAPDPVAATDPAAALEDSVDVEAGENALAAAEGQETKSLDDILAGLGVKGDATAPSMAEAWATAEEQAKTGTLTEDALDDLKAAGGTDGMLRVLADRAKSVQTERIADAVRIAGSQGDLSKAINWAKSKMLLSERQQLAQALTGPNASMVMEGLVARARAAGAMGEPGTLQDVPGSPPLSSNAALRPFADGTEYMAAMGNPQYRKDPEYRREVAKRHAITVGKDPSRFDGIPM